MNLSPSHFRLSTNTVSCNAPPVKYATESSFCNAGPHTYLHQTRWRSSLAILLAFWRKALPKLRVQAQTANWLLAQTLSGGPQGAPRTPCKKQVKNNIQGILWQTFQPHLADQPTATDSVSLPLPSLLFPIIWSGDCLRISRQAKSKSPRHRMTSCCIVHKRKARVCQMAVHTRRQTPGSSSSVSRSVCSSLSTTLLPLQSVTNLRLVL